MTVFKYLRQYNRDEDRLLFWLNQHGADKVVASMIIETYANINKQFKSGYDLDHAVLKECLEDHKKTVSELLAKHKKYNYKPSTWDVLRSKVRQLTGKQ